MEYKDNIVNLFSLFTNESVALKFMMDNRLIYQEIFCNKCRLKMTLVIDNSKKNGYKWSCYKCHKTHSILYGSIFYGSKIPMSKVLYLLYFWVNEYSYSAASHEVDININTVTYYFTLFRNACDSFIISSSIQQIGGQGKTVQIDETLMCHRKYHVGRILNQVWIFGGVCIEDHQFFCLVVPDRTSKTLKEEIMNHILPGTTIISDCWKGYDCLDSCNEFEHLTVDHSKNFVNPINGANTQTIERMWRELKKINKKYEGIPRNKINEHISEFILRNNIINNSYNKFQAAVALIADTQFIMVEDAK